MEEMASGFLSKRMGRKENRWWDQDFEDDSLNAEEYGVLEGYYGGDD